MSGPLILVASLYCRSLAGLGFGSQDALTLTPSVPTSFELGEGDRGLEESAAAVHFKSPELLWCLPRLQASARSG